MLFINRYYLALPKVPKKTEAELELASQYKTKFLAFLKEGKKKKVKSSNNSQDNHDYSKVDVSHLLFQTRATLGIFLL